MHARSAKATSQTRLQNVPHSLPYSTSALICSTRIDTPQVPQRLTHVVVSQEATSQLSQGIWEVVKGCGGGDLQAQHVQV